MAIVQRIAEAHVPAVLRVLAQAGGTARSADSWAHDHMTALVLGEPGAPDAAMPMACRQIRTAPGRQIAAGWLSSNQFASRMSFRRQTRPTAAQWADLLPELDALLVMRRDESSLPARWYAQTGFCDALSIRCLYLEMETPPGAPLAGAAGAGARYQVQVVTPQEGQWDAAAWQAQMLAVYRDVYGSFGGAMPRHAGFWQSAIEHHYYREHYQFQIVGLWNADGSLMGYALIGWSGWHSKRPRMDILELATRQWDTAVAGDLIRTTCQLAWSKSVRQVRAVISVHDPYRGHLARTGFVDRWGYLLQAKWLHPQRVLKAMRIPPELGDFWVELVASGEVPLAFGRGARSAPATQITLRGEAGAITRLLLNRCDLSAALQDGTLVPAAPLSDRDAARLSHCFPWAPWVFHMLDYI